MGAFPFFPCCDQARNIFMAILKACMTGNIKNDIEVVLDFYFHLYSIEMS
jgi:glutaminase